MHAAVDTCPSLQHALCPAELLARCDAEITGKLAQCKHTRLAVPWQELQQLVGLPTSDGLPRMMSVLAVRTRWVDDQILDMLSQVAPLDQPRDCLVSGSMHGAGKWLVGVGLSCMPWLHSSDSTTARPCGSWHAQGWMQF